MTVCLNVPDRGVQAFASVWKDSVTSPLFQLTLVTTSLVIFCQCIYLALCIIRDFFRPQHCCEAVNYSVQYVSPPFFFFFPQLLRLTIWYKASLFTTHTTGWAFSSLLAELPLAMRILLFILLGSVPPSDGAPLVGNVCWQTTKSILILRGTDCPQVLQGTSSVTVPSQASCPGHKHSPVSSGRDRTCSTRTTWRGCSRVAVARLPWTEVACCWPRCCWCHPAPWTPSHHCIQQHESFSVWKQWGQNNLAYVSAKLHAEEDYLLLNHTTWEPQPSLPGHHLKLLEPYKITQQSGQQENLHHLLLPLSPCSGSCCTRPLAAVHDE